jgi:hypothetical protein
LVLESLVYQRIHKSSSMNPPSPEKSAQLAPRPFAAQAQQDFLGPPTIIPVEQERASRVGHTFANLLVHAPGRQGSAPVQPRVEDRPTQANGNTAGDRPALSVAQQPNKTGMPGPLKAAVESLSGYSLDGVRVYYNSPKPAPLQALAYTQGTEIHVAPGQERHLPHEAWHAVQQAQGRVQPTMQLKDGVPLNDNQGLEHEADVMGEAAAGAARAVRQDAKPDPIPARPATHREVAQLRRIETLFGPIAQMTGSESAMTTAGGEAAPQVRSGQRSAPVGVVQRQLFYNGVHYKQDNVGDLEKIPGLPPWTDLQLTSQSTFVLDRDRVSWVPDAQLEFKRYKDNVELAKKTHGASYIRQFGDVGFAPDAEGKRIGPKHPDMKYVERVTIVKNSLQYNGHWSLQCEVLGGKRAKGMKVDLTSVAYRVLYGAIQDNPELTKVDFTLKAPVALPVVYDTFVEIAKANGKWTGNKVYNCQDFALEMLRRLSVQGVQEETALAEQTGWREQTKRL